VRFVVDKVARVQALLRILWVSSVIIFASMLQKRKNNVILLFCKMLSDVSDETSFVEDPQALPACSSDKGSIR
jgi:hypothetical protein